jgi:hypothetical protein
MLEHTGMNMRLLLVSGVGGWLMSGCVSTGMARTLNKGQFQFSAAPGIHSSVRLGDLANSEVRPHAELGVRYGVTDRLDVGGRLFLSGAAVDTRIGLVRAPSLDRGVDLTLAPILSLTNRGTGDDKQLIAELPLLLGINPGAGIQVVIGPRVGTTFVVDPGTIGEPKAMVGTSLGVALPLGKWLRVVPEVTVHTFLSNPGPIVLGNVGFLVGGYAED